ncbi:hypothetical protein YB2330_000758 [Saitoella coloradoensis]
MPAQELHNPWAKQQPRMSMEAMQQQQFQQIPQMNMQMKTDLPDMLPRLPNAPEVMSSAPTSSGGHGHRFNQYSFNNVNHGDFVTNDVANFRSRSQEEPFYGEGYEPTQMMHSASISSSSPALAQTPNSFTDFAAPSTRHQSFSHGTFNRPSNGGLQTAPGVPSNFNMASRRLSSPALFAEPSYPRYDPRQAAAPYPRPQMSFNMSMHQSTTPTTTQHPNIPEEPTSPHAAPTFTVPNYPQQSPRTMSANVSQSGSNMPMNAPAGSTLYDRRMSHPTLPSAPMPMAPPSNIRLRQNSMFDLGRVPGAGNGVGMGVGVPMPTMAENRPMSQNQNQNQIQPRDRFQETLDSARGMIAMSSQPPVPSIGNGSHMSYSNQAFSPPSMHADFDPSTTRFDPDHSHNQCRHGSFSDRRFSETSIGSSGADEDTGYQVAPATSAQAAAMAGLQSMMTTFSSKQGSNSAKKHKCHVCQKGFTRPSSLQTHMYSHTGEKREYLSALRDVQDKG